MFDRTVSEEHLAYNRRSASIERIDAPDIADTILREIEAFMSGDDRID